MIGGNVAIFVPHSGCPNQCSFCDQKVISGTVSPPTPAEVTALCKESLAYLGERAKDCELAFFGGSFTAIEPYYRRALLRATKGFIGENGFGGIRISTRPDAITVDILRELQAYGVTAIELGAQSMCDTVLRLNHRGHSAEQVKRSSVLIKQMGFSLGLQMMTGLYGSSWRWDMETGRALLALKPDTIRIYPTITLPGTELATLYQQGIYHPPTLEDTVSLVADLMLLFREGNVNILKIGLHSSEELESRYLAGPYHPAFRELCEGEILLSKVKKQIVNQKRIQIIVNTKEVSKMIGQKKQNLMALMQMGVEAKVVGKKDHPLYTPQLLTLE